MKNKIKRAPIKLQRRIEAAIMRRTAQSIPNPGAGGDGSAGDPYTISSFRANMAKALERVEKKTVPVFITKRYADEGFVVLSASMYRTLLGVPERHR